MIETPAERDRFIDIWRGIAVLMVVLYHYASRLPLEAYGYARQPILQVPVGLLGVEIFFVISGFLVGPAAARAPMLAGFLARRVARIWPLLALAACTVFVFTQFLPPPVVPAGPQRFSAAGRDLADLAGTIFLLKDLGFAWIDGAYWSLLVEMKFYVLLTVLAALGRERFPRWLGAIALVVGATYLISLQGDSDPLRLLRRLTAFAIGPYLPFFAIGVYWGLGQRPPMLAINLALAAGMIALKLDKEGALVGSSVAPGFLVLTALVALDWLTLRSRGLLWIGRYSYAIYLFHQVIGLSLLARIGPHLNPDLAILLVTGLVFGLARAGSYLAEYRFQRFVVGRLTPALAFGVLRRPGPRWRPPAEPTGEGGVAGHCAAAAQKT